ncbi:MAG: MarR family transcriptional regulator [Pseudomonadota bacterium]
MIHEIEQLEPREAVARAFSAGPGAEAHLDRYLVQRTLAALLDRAGDEGALGLALVDALDLLPEGDPAWRARWRLLLELVREARDAPSAARDLHAVAPTGRAAALLRALAQAPRPLQPSELARGLGRSLPAVSNVLKELDQADLVQRQRLGRHVLVQLTARGRRLAALLGEPVAAEPVAPTAAWETFWPAPVER